MGGEPCFRVLMVERGSDSPSRLPGAVQVNFDLPAAARLHFPTTSTSLFRALSGHLVIASFSCISAVFLCCRLGSFVFFLHSAWLRTFGADMAISSGRRGGGLARLLLASGALVVGGAEAVIRGVNLGGWLVTEPWMTPTLYQSTNTTCEWDLCNALGKQDCLTALQQHWSCVMRHDHTPGRGTWNAYRW